MILVVVIPTAHFAVMIVVRELLVAVIVIVTALVIAFVVSVPVALSISLGLRESWTACKEKNSCSANRHPRFRSHRIASLVCEVVNHSVQIGSLLGARNRIACP
jgi:hypothetical protein